jgi:ketosteroid isomerase-like protein
MLLLNLLPLLALLAPPPSPAADSIDAFWAEAVRTVVEGDFEGYAALYHEDAVIVSTFTNDARPIAAALGEWQQYFVDTAEGRMEAGLEFRFTQRLHGETTAHETGMFFYRLHPPGETPEPTYIHFESLLVKGADGWKWVMEFQKSVATAEEWEAAGS